MRDVIKMAKKTKRLLICHCKAKRKLRATIPGKQMIAGEKCFCLPYNAKVGKGTNYEAVLIN